MAEALIFRIHAVQRMSQRRISVENVRQALETGHTIENYPDDFPYPSSLILGWVESRPLHVVVAHAPEKKIVITVYEPDPAQWTSDFKIRKP